MDNDAFVMTNNLLLHHLDNLAMTNYNTMYIY